MKLYTFPKALHSIDGVTVLLHAEDNCILHKKLHSDVENADVLNNKEFITGYMHTSEEDYLHVLSLFDDEVK